AQGEHVVGDGGVVRPLAASASARPAPRAPRKRIPKAAAAESIGVAHRPGPERPDIEPLAHLSGEPSAPAQIDMKGRGDKLHGWGGARVMIVPRAGYACARAI